MSVSAGRFEELFDRYQNGDAAPGEVAELESLLQGDSVLRQRLVERCLLEVHLHKVFAGAANPGNARGMLRFRPVVTWLAAASVLLVLGLTTFWYLQPRAASGLQIVSGQARIEGSAVQEIQLDMPFESTGAAPLVIRLGDGSEAEFRPSSQVVIHGQREGARQVIALTHGGGNFKVAHGGGQFRVDTPVGKVIALGTEFSAYLRAPAKGKKPADKQGRLFLAVNVKNGTVRVENDATSKTLTAGQRLVVGDNGQMNDHDDGDMNNKDDGDQN